MNDLLISNQNYQLLSIKQKIIILRIDYILQVDYCNSSARKSI